MSENPGQPSTSQPVIRRNNRLPSGRAVLGGLLVTLAVLGLLIANNLAADDDIRPVVVARVDLAPGMVIEPEHVALISARIDESATWVADDLSAVHGAVVLGPIARLEFIQDASIRQGPATGDIPGGVAEVSISIEPERAPASLASGELVSVYATFDNEDGSPTVLIADRVVVLSYRAGDGDFASGDAVLRLGLSDGETAARIINADRTGDISIVGVTGADAVELPEVVRR